MTTKHYFDYGEKELEYLKRKDKKLGALIDELGYLKREVSPDIFAALVESVIAQQISDKAATAIHGRLKAMTEIDAVKIKKASVDDIQKCGLSARKAEYIKNIAEAVISKEVDADKMRTMSNGEITEKLTAIKGVGVWTAEMMLIFSFGRPDVISYGDLGIRRNMMKLYGIKSLPKDKFSYYAKRYSPYATIASFYLWAMTDERIL